VSEPLPTFVAGHQDSWHELDAMLAAARGSVGRLDPAGVRRLGRLYRHTVADLAYARRAYPKDPVTVRLDDLVRRARPLLYGTVRERESLVRFVTTGYWQRVRERPLLLVIATLSLFLPALVVGVWSHGHPEAAGRVAQVSPLTAGLGDGDVRDPDTQKETDLGVNVGLSGEIFTNNARVALAAFAGGVRWRHDRRGPHAGEPRVQRAHPRPGGWTGDQGRQRRLAMAPRDPQACWSCP